MHDDTDWTLISFDEPKKLVVAVDAGTDDKTVRRCPKCSRQLGRGGHFHVKRCKGASE